MNHKKGRAEACGLGFSPEGDALANAHALQEAVNEYEYVTVSVPGIYDIAGSIRLPSDTHLRFTDGVIIRRVPLADRLAEGNLFVNEGAFSGTFNENISIEGAHIAVNGVESAAISSDGDASAIPLTPNVVTGLRGHIAFLYVKHLHIDNVVITDLMSKDYGIQVSDFEDVIIENVHIEGKKDGVHFGPGKNFILRNGEFRTGDDAIALNCADYSVSNPNFGTISGGLIENCTELAGSESSLFIRILTGTARDWKKGMTVCHSDAVRTKSGMYRVVMKPDNKKYISETEPRFEETCKKLDGIFWIKTHRGYDSREISLEAGCSDITFRNITLEQPRENSVLIYMNDDAYLHSRYPGSAIPRVENIRFGSIRLMKPVDSLLRVEMPAENISFQGAGTDWNTP
jgi:hypothetical protein